MNSWLQDQPLNSHSEHHEHRLQPPQASPFVPTTSSLPGKPAAALSLRAAPCALNRACESSSDPLKSKCSLPANNIQGRKTSPACLKDFTPGNSAVLLLTLFITR